MADKPTLEQRLKRLGQEIESFEEFAQRIEKTIQGSQNMKAHLTGRPGYTQYFNSFSQRKTPSEPVSQQLKQQNEKLSTSNFLELSYVSHKKKQRP